MPISRERYLTGTTYADWVAAMTRNRERLEAAEKNIQIDPADVAFFKGLPRTTHVAVLAEDWCGDVIANLPVLARLSQESGKIDFRIFNRDQNLDLMDQYLNRGEFRSIPVFVIMDHDFKEIGSFKERPDSVTKLRAEKRVQVYASDPAFGSPDSPVESLPEDVRARLQAALARSREETVPFANREVVRELREIFARAA